MRVFCGSHGARGAALSAANSHAGDACSFVAAGAGTPPEADEGFRWACALLQSALPETDEAAEEGWLRVRAATATRPLCARPAPCRMSKQR